MNSIQVETIVDEATARVIPALRPLIGQRVRLTVARARDSSDTESGRLTVDELLAARLTPREGAGVSLADMERAIQKGAFGAID